jgi:hypothetical protein
MWRVRLLRLALWSVTALPLTAACPCMVRFGVCNETRQSDAVFIGTVESVAPPFLDPFARAKAMASIPTAEAARLQADSSPEALALLKDVYLKMFTGLPDYAKAQIAEAKTQRALQTAFEAVESEGRVARFRVRTQFKRDAGDDDDKKPAASSNDDKRPAGAAKKDDDDTPEFLDVWTGSGECGIDFQVGETYLVYAIEDEDSGKLETSVCMRTRRLTEEKGDLGFLYFVQNAAKESTRLEGFVSTSFADQNLPLYEDSVAAPSPGAILELDTGAAMRYTQSDAQGRFSFDGLKAGDYRLSLLDAGFPRSPRTVILSRTFHASEEACARQILILPRSSAAQSVR